MALEIGRANTDAVRIAEEEHALALALGALGRLDPLADARRAPQSAEEAHPAGRGIGAVMAAHDGLDGVAGFVGVVERDRADVVVQDVGLDDAVEDVAADEAKVPVNRGRCAARKVPYFRLVVREAGICVLEVGNCHCVC